MALLKGISKTIIALGFVSFLTDVSSEMISPLIPIFITGVLGAGIVTLGLIEGIADSTASIFEVVSGRISDKIRKRKVPILAGYSTSTLAKALLPLTNTWPLVLIARFADCVGKGIRTSPRDALMTDITKKKSRGKAFGIQRAFDSSGAFLGPLISALLLSVLVLPPLAAYQTVFAVALVPAAFAVLVIILFVRETKPKKTAKTFKLAIKSLTPRFKKFMFVYLFFSLSYFSFAFLIVRAYNLGFSVTLTLAMYAGFSAVQSLTSIPFGSLSDRIGRKKVILLGFLLYAAICAGFAFATSAWITIPLFLLYGLFLAIDDVVVRTYVADLSRGWARATSIGTFNALSSVVYLPASIAAGLIWAAAGAQLTFGFAALISLISAAGLIIFCRE